MLSSELGGADHIYQHFKYIQNTSRDSLISEQGFEALANYTKTNMKIIPYFKQSLQNLEELIDSIRKREPKLF